MNFIRTHVRNQKNQSIAVMAQYWIHPAISSCFFNMLKIAIFFMTGQPLFH